MKNLFKILSMILILALSVSMVACGNGNKGDAGNGGHTHEFTQKVVEEKFFKEEATCEHADLYYYSCTCGEKGTATFEEGRELDHVFEQMVEQDRYLCTEGDCETPATYYFSCTCGECGTETFESLEEPDHHYEDGVCTTCGDPEFLPEE